MYEFSNTTASPCVSTSFRFTSLTTYHHREWDEQSPSGVVANGQLLFSNRTSLCSVKYVDVQWEFILTAASNQSLAISIILSNTDICSKPTSATGCRITLHTASNPTDALYGFGVQYSVWNMKGRVVPILVSEQGVGRGLQPLTDFLDLVSFHQGGTWNTT